MVEWYVYALVTMLFFSFANITLKSLLTEDLMGALQNNFNSLIPAAVMVAAAVIAAYFLFLTKLQLSSNTIFLLILFVTLAGSGFLFLMMAVSSGKIAPVTAIVSSSSVTVAILSIIVLRESLSLREIAGILTAFVGVLMLVYK